MLKLTTRQAQVLDIIRRYIDDTGYPPTRADIARELGFRSANAAEEHLKALARKGAIEMVAGASRGLRLVEERGIPVVGRVAAGSPILAQEHIDHRLDIPPQTFHPPADYFLEVQGDSMVKAGIFDGDLLAVHHTDTVREQQIVVARIDDEVTVKRWHRVSSQRVQLLPENDAYTPIDVDLRHQALVIEGISVGVIRRH